MRRDVFQAIADPTRRAIIALIAFRSMTPNAIAEHFKTSRQAVSKHIKILNDCELLESRTAGREIFYQVDAAKMQEVDLWLEQFKVAWNQSFNQLDELLQSSKHDKNGNKRNSL